MVGLTGFEPAASSSRTTRATKLRHSPKRASLSESFPGTTTPGAPNGDTAAGADPAGGSRQPGTSVTRDASGRQQKRTGAFGDVPSPADTCIHDGW